MFRERRKTKVCEILHNGSTEIRNDFESYTPEELEFKVRFYYSLSNDPYPQKINTLFPLLTDCF